MIGVRFVFYGRNMLFDGCKCSPLLCDGWEAYPELEEEAVCPSSLSESHTARFVTSASSNRGLNLQQEQSNTEGYS